MQLKLLAEEAEREGFVAFKGYFPDLAKAAHAELDEWFEIDLESRRKSGERSNYHVGAAGRSVLTASMHILQDVFAKSPSLDQMFETALIDEQAGGLIRHLAGNNLKLRGYNVRRMTGVVNNSEMEWHRDNPGEIGWSLLLTDANEGSDSSTTIVRGSHLFPYCPRNHLLLRWTGYPGWKLFQRLNIFSRMIHNQHVDGKSVSASGNAGDFYVFINDLWHGRGNNTHGKRTMVFLASVFPSEVKFPDEVSIPPPEILQKLPPNLRQIVDYRATPDNPDKSAYVHRMMAARTRVGFLTLWHLAQLERRAVDLLSTPKIWILDKVLVPLYRWLRSFSFLAPTVKRFAQRLRPNS